MKHFLKYYVPKYLHRIEQEYQRKKPNQVLNYLVENNEEDIFELVAFDEFKFDNFDLKVVELLNDYYDGNPDPTIGGLEKVFVTWNKGITRSGFSLRA